MKVCTKCKKEKELSEFRNDKYTKSGKTTRCKECLKTFKPKEITCRHCHSWFTQKQSNYAFCSPKCHDRYWSKIDRLTMKRFFYMREYWKKYKREQKVSSVVAHQ